MKAKLILVYLMVILFHPATVCFAQSTPPNDNCSSATDLTSGAACTSGFEKNGTTETGESKPSCAAGSINSSKTVWYKFVADSTSMYLQLYITGFLPANATSYNEARFAAEVYNSASCIPGLATQKACTHVKAVGDSDHIMELNLSSLVVNNTYLVQIYYQPGVGTATPQFCISVGKNYSSTCGTCSSPCGAACVFAYTPTIAQVKSACSSRGQVPYLEGGQNTTQCYTFTATSTNMNFGLAVDSSCTINVSSTSSLTWTLYNSSCGSLQTGTNTSKMFTGLTVGQSYTFCYTLTNNLDCYQKAYYPYVYPNQTLPIELSSFQGNQNGESVNLNWTTASEVNNDYFVVQRSADGTNWEDLTKIDGQGTSSIQHAYSFADHAPKKGTNYYRLEQVDAGISNVQPSDGDVKIHYSQVIAVLYAPIQQYEFKMTGSYAEVNLLQSAESYVIVFDERGMIVYSNFISGPANFQIPLTEKHGVWYACLIQGGRKELMSAF